MNIELFHSTYNMSRNGANDMTRHSLVRSFIFSDGVMDLCDAGGCYWLLDILATELPQVLRAKREHMGVIECAVADNKAALRMTGGGDAVLWTRKIGYTDMPPGDWTFYLTDDGDTRTLILPTEY